MKRLIALFLGLTLAVTVSTGVEAQLGGLLRKKAGEVLGKKPPAPAPAPAPEPAPGEDAPSPTPATPGGADTRDTSPARGRDAASPLDVSELPVRQSADQVLRDRVRARESGDWDQLPFIPPAAVAAAYALGESAQVALVETVGAAVKSTVMSAAFMAEHDEYIKREHKAVNHGLTGVVTMEEAVKRNDMKALEAIQLRQTLAAQIELSRSVPADYLKTQFDEELADWKKQAANTGRRDRAKYQKLVAAAQPLEGLAPGDEKFRRGYAVLKSIENDGPDEEAAVFALYDREKQEQEQIAYDQHNLKGQLQRNLTAFVAIASKVNFGAQTVEKNGKTLFVNPADERQGAIWKACFRAGEAPTAAAIKLARAWLAEL
ncbi:MAG: hypothetical protein AB7Q16_17285 [Vicinamibacterales bacterium]